MASPDTLRMGVADSPSLSAPSIRQEWQQQQQQRMQPVADVKITEMTRQITADDLPSAAMDDSSTIPIAVYVPLGAFTFASPADRRCGEWSETTDVESCPDPTFRQVLNSLIAARWIRCLVKSRACSGSLDTVRVYVLPFDVARREVPRSGSGALQSKLNKVLNKIDTSSGAWSGHGKAFGEAPQGIVADAQSDDESLFYIFNTIQSPNPDSSSLEDHFDRTVVDRLLSKRDDAALGFITTPYPYQRRSIATMIQREVQPRLMLDPRLQQHEDQMGETYYHDRVWNQIFKKSSHYEEPKGGMLAETMGFGKTFIVLGLILATRHQMPSAPFGAELPETPVGAHGANSLMSMAATVARRRNVPWREYFDELEGGSPQSFHRCRRLLQRPVTYQLKREAKWKSRQEAPISNIHLCHTTLVVVPANLFQQWKQEVTKHIVPNALSVLAVDKASPPLGDTPELAQYDMILMEHSRFLVEIGYSAQPSGAQTSAEHASEPLRRMHFLRLVVDEGHKFASSGGGGSAALWDMVNVERRWIVTGTPSSGMIGAEIEMAAYQQADDPANLAANNRDESRARADAQERAQEILNLNRKRLSQDNDDLKRLGRIVKDLLHVQPWCNSSVSQDSASWTDYTKLGSGASTVASIRSIMESLIVRHQFGEIEAELPPLYNRTVYLDPTVFDRYTMDMFTLVMACNSITSERTDQDYIFDKRNWRDLDLLIRNLRRSSFHWGGFSSADIQNALNRLVLHKEEKKPMLDSDHHLIDKATGVMPNIMSDKIWLPLNEKQEMGYSISCLPQTIAMHLGVDPASATARMQAEFGDLNPTSSPQESAVLPSSKIIGCQVFLDGQVDKGNPDPLGELGSCVTVFAERDDSALTRKMLNDEDQEKEGKLGAVKKTEKLNGIPKSGFRKDIQLNPKELNAHKTLGLVKVSGKRKRASMSTSSSEPLPAGSIRLTGTISAKLSYILSKVVDLYKQEKILIFYEGDDIAWYIAQGLEIIGVPHFIYANHIGPKIRNKYHETFAREDSEERVMLIDLRQGSHGLNITSASRIFFVNPVWNAGAEAQAIKRAHRIGQTRPVHVETLILKDSIEEKMFARRTRLNPEEKQRVQRNPLDDEEVVSILQDFHFRGQGGDEKAPEERRLAPIASAPLLFPKVHEYLTAMRTTKGGTEPKSQESAIGTARFVEERVTNGEAMTVPPKPKKQARFA